MGTRKSPETVEGLPVTVREFVANFKQGHAFHSKAERFRAHFASSDMADTLLERYWKLICANARATATSEHGEVAVFMMLPDRAAFNPYSALHPNPVREVRLRDGDGLERTEWRVSELTPDDIDRRRERYENARDAITKLVPVLNDLLSDHRSGRPFQTLLEDASASPTAYQAACEFREVEGDVRRGLVGLKRLQALLVAVDPAAIVPTPQWRSDDAPRKNYIRQVAGLNRYLDKPQHAALAYLAQVNCPDVGISNGDVRDAWRAIQSEASEEAVGKRT